MSIVSGPKIVTDGLVYCADAGNPKSYSPNTFPIPLDIFGWSGPAANAATLSRDPTTSPSPAGGIPMKMAISGNDPHTGTTNSSIWNVSTAASGQTWTVSVYVKGAVATTGEIFIFGADSSGVWTTFPDYGAGSITITTEWTRVSYSFTFSNANVAFIQFRLDGTPTGGTGTNIWWDGIQVEQASSASAFNPIKNTNRTNLFDMSGNGVSASLNGTYSFANNAIRLVNNNATATNNISHIQIGNLTNITTVSLWYYVNAIPAIRYLLDMRTGGDGGWIYSAGTGGNWASGTLYVNGGTAQSVIWENIEPSINVWRNITVIANTSATDDINLFSRVSDNEGYDVTFGEVYIYNRVLSETENRENFNALRGRYGI
jgi:hypothetical protein